MKAYCSYCQEPKNVSSMELTCPQCSNPLDSNSSDVLHDMASQGELGCQMKAKAQRQDSLHEQLRDLIDIANKNGMYDAADYLMKVTQE